MYGRESIGHSNTCFPPGHDSRVFDGLYRQLEMTNGNMNTGNVVSVRPRAFIPPSTRLEHPGPQGYTALYKIVQEATDQSGHLPGASVSMGAN